jgi:hypothetical protein
VVQGLTILPVKLSLDGEELLVDTCDGNGSSCNFFAKKLVLQGTGVSDLLAY